jgi:diguanylate cyclase (GGDEF)-like protein
MHVSARIALTYLILSILWILLSDKVLFALFPDYFNLISLYKGWAFVSLSALILYIFIRREELRRDQAEDQLIKASITDALTGLRNRPALLSHLDHALTVAHREQRGFGILFIDIDNFKTINDSKGHTAGDAFLSGVADRLKCCTRSSDICARFGGDEFVIFVSNDADLDTLAHRLVDSFQQPIETDFGKISATVSIGVAKYPIHGENIDQLIHAADTAMYQAKAAGRAQVAEAPSPTP